MGGTGAPVPEPPPGAPQKAFHVSWDQFHRDARALAWRLNASAPFSGMVAVTRGGLVPAAIVSRELDLRIIDTFCVRSYAGESVQGAIEVLKGVSSQMARDGGRGLLVIDDLADTGATAKAVRALLPHAHVATVYAKPLGRALVDTFITEVSQDTWILFPVGSGLKLSSADRRTPVRDAERCTLVYAARRA